jgi:hypothetical protein
MRWTRISMAKASSKKLLTMQLCNLRRLIKILLLMQKLTKHNQVITNVTLERVTTQ